MCFKLVMSTSCCSSAQFPSWRFFSKEGSNVNVEVLDIYFNLTSKIHSNNEKESAMERWKEKKLSINVNLVEA